MLNTLFVIVILAVVIPICYLVDLNERRKKNRFERFSAPSSAIIDQMLPVEILAQILAVPKLQTFGRCACVSKYWNYVTRSDYMSRILTNDDRLNTSEHRYESIYYDGKEIPMSELPRMSYHDNYKKEWHVQDAAAALRRSQVIADIRDPTFFFASRPYPAYAWNHFMIKMRARCVGVTAHSFKLQNEYAIYIDKTNHKMADIFTYGKEIEILTDIPNVEVHNNFVLLVKQIFGCRLTEQVSFIDRYKPALTDWIMIALLLFVPSIAQDYRQYVRPFFPQWFQLLMDIAMIGLLVKWILKQDQQLKHQQSAMMLLYNISAIMALTTMVLNVDFIAWMAHSMVMVIGGTVMLTAIQFFFSEAINHRIISRKLIVLSSILVLLLGALNWTYVLPTLQPGHILTIALVEKFIELELTMVYFVAVEYVFDENSSCRYPVPEDTIFRFMLMSAILWMFSPNPRYMHRLG